MTIHLTKNEVQQAIARHVSTIVEHGVKPEDVTISYDLEDNDIFYSVEVCGTIFDEAQP